MQVSSRRSDYITAASKISTFSVASMMTKFHRRNMKADDKVAGREKRNSHDNFPARKLFLDCFPKSFIRFGIVGCRETRVHGQRRGC